MSNFAHDWIAKREYLEQAATQGPWRRVTEPGTKNHALHDARDADIATDYEGVWYNKGDAEFIADARTSLPAARRALKAVLGATEGKTEHYGHTPLGGDDCVACLAADVRDAVEAALRGES